MYVFGGFNSLLLSDILTYTSPSCSAFTSPSSCSQAWPGIHCVWNGSLGACLPWEGNSSSAEPQQQLQQLPASCNTRSCRSNQVFSILLEMSDRTGVDPEGQLSCVFSALLSLLFVKKISTFKKSPSSASTGGLF